VPRAKEMNLVEAISRLRISSTLALEEVLTQQDNGKTLLRLSGFDALADQFIGTRRFDARFVK
jgi:hypothetical protein